jgi:hypothetical protein
MVHVSQPYVIDHVLNASKLKFLTTWPIFTKVRISIMTLRPTQEANFKFCRVLNNKWGIAMNFLCGTPKDAR